MIRIVWLCYFSNREVRKYLPIRYRFFERLERVLSGQSLKPNVSDIAIWNTRAIKEFETHPEIELHVVSPCSYLASKQVSFVIRGVHYVFIENEEVSFRKRLITHLSNRPYGYRKNREHIIEIINEIKPNVVHVIGAENPFYSLALLDIEKPIKTVVQLQTLVSDPVFADGYPISRKRLEYLRGVERQVISCADYVGTTVQRYKDLIDKLFGGDVVLVPTSLPLSEDCIGKELIDKSFDFVYFSLNINKAADIAIESFAIAKNKHPEITLDIVGGYTNDYKQELETRLKELSIQESVYFEGCLETHDDVIRQIRKSKYALLPLKVDMVSGTIREAQANGLPVITTITKGTPALNKDRECVLLSPIDDINEMANNMVRLIEDDSLADTLRKNSLISAHSRESSKKIVDDYISFYKTIVQ